MDDLPLELADSIADRYRLVRTLGAGGMAVVVLAEDLRHGREVAIKVMRRELTRTVGTERFLREIRLLARLQHPHILGLVDSGEAGGALYYVMPYLPGGSLRERLERERELPVADAIAVLREVAGALEHAHAEGIVHRDIKPENVLFSAGHAQVADFGIARIVGGDAAATLLTTAGVTLGTPQYMAPEQAAGDPRTDHRADLYAFGVLAYELLAGQPPFVASGAAQVMALHMHQEPVALSRHRPSVPATLEQVVMRCLAKRPADRWQSAGELRAALERALDADGGGAAGPQSPGTVAARMPITEAIARRIERANFDPRMIGDSLEYLDNQTESDVLVMLLHAAWLGGSDFEPHLRTLPYRCIAPTLFGFGEDARHRHPLSLRDHTMLMGELLRLKTAECNPARVVVVGFSASGDLVLRLAAGLPEGARLDAVLALGCNQGIETCFVSRVLAGLDSNDPAKLLAAMRSISDTASSLDDWMLLNGYLTRIMTRFRADVSPLRALALDFVRPFHDDDRGAFAAMYHEAARRVRHVRCVFEDSEVCNRLLKHTLMDHMDRGVLGEHHRDGALLIEPTPSHFELIQPQRVAAHLEAMVEAVRSAAG